MKKKEAEESDVRCDKDLGGTLGEDIKNYVTKWIN
jgi:hypothetical protein